MKNSAKKVFHYFKDSVQIFKVSCFWIEFMFKKNTLLKNKTYYSTVEFSNLIGLTASPSKSEKSGGVY